MNSEKGSNEYSLLDWTLYIDECIDSPVLDRLLAQANLAVVRHKDRWQGKRGLKDAEWVEAIWAERRLIVTADHGRKDAELLRELARVAAPCIFVHQDPPAQLELWLTEHSRSIGSALARRGQGSLLLYLRRDGQLEARQHGSPSRYRVKWRSGDNVNSVGCQKSTGSTI